mgnify:CR=1 FL=1
MGFFYDDLGVRWPGAVVAAAALIITFSALHERSSMRYCEEYSSLNKAHTKHVLLDGCYVKRDEGWELVR